MRAIDVYNGSEGETTVKYYKLLQDKGPLGEIAVALFRAQKCSARAKSYRKRKWKDDAYSRKTWSIGELCNVLELHGSEFELSFGWKQDFNVLFDNDKPSWVFYIDIPGIGQVSFHCKDRGNVGPDYAGEWDGMKGMSTGRVIRFCDAVFNTELVEIKEGWNRIRLS